MRRYLELLHLFWTTALAAEMEYRSNFLLAGITSLGNLVGSVFAIWLFYRKLNVLGGYSFDEALIVLGFFVLLEGVANTVFRQNLSRIVAHVREGTLDFILLKPVDSQFWLSARNCSPWGIPNIVLGAALVFYGGTHLHFGPGDYAMGLLPLALGMVMLYSLWFILGATTIWFVKIQNITHVLYQLLEAGRFPVTAYPPVYRFAFTFLVPVAFLTTFPAQMMIGHAVPGTLGEHRWVLLGTSLVMATGLLAISRIFWRFALRYYTSASS